MGMDLVANKRYKGKQDTTTFNLAGWKYVIQTALKHGVPTTEFSQFNDGEPICEETCLKLADAFEAEVAAGTAGDETLVEWNRKKVEFFRRCGGCKQR